MRLNDKITLAIKNIKEEGTKSILTIFIVFILFFLLTSIVVIGSSFYVSINNTYEQLLDNKKVNISCQILGGISNEKYEQTKDLLKGCKYVNEVTSSFGNVNLYDFDYLKIEGLDLESAKNKNYVFLNSSYKDEYRIDDTFNALYGDLIVKGFFYNMSDGAIADLDYFQYNAEDSFSYLNIVCDLSEETSYKTSLKEINNLKNILKNTFESANSTELDDIANVTNTSKIILGLVIFIAFVLLVLSIGTVSNSIIITMDKNYYLTGLYKALGMTDEDTFNIVLIQTIITIVSGSIVASVLILCLRPVFAILTKSLFDFIVRAALNVDIQMLIFNFTFPTYIPILMAILFIIFSLLFARASIGKIVRATPINIINEVSQNEK